MDRVSAPAAAEDSAAPEFQMIRGGGCTCQIVSEFATTDLATRLTSGSGAFDWPELEVVKSSTVRTVFAGSIALGEHRTVDAHVKSFRAVTLSDRARDAVTGARAIRELDNLVEAQRRGIATVEPLAAARCTGSFGARSVLVTRTVDAAAFSWQDAPPPPPAAVALVGRALRAAHDAGLHARDLHPGNLLVTPDHRRAVLCDLTSAQWANPLEEDERAHAIAFFCLALDGGPSDPAARELVTAYGLPDRLRAEARRRFLRLRQRALGAFGRRATRACRHTRVESPDGKGTWYVRRDAVTPGDPLEAAMRAWRPAASDSEPIKTGRRGGVWQTPSFVVKRRFARGAARRLFTAAYWLDFAAVPCAEPLALHLHDRGGDVFAARVPGETVSARLTTASMSLDEQLTAARDLGTSLGRLHAHGLRNRDLKLENLVADPKRGRIVIVDLDGVRRRAPDELRGQAADLGRLLASYLDTRPGPHAQRVVDAFVRRYHRARLWLRNPAPRRLYVHSEARSRQWRRSAPVPGTNASSAR